MLEQDNMPSTERLHSAKANLHQYECPRLHHSALGETPRSKPADNLIRTKTCLLLSMPRQGLRHGLCFFFFGSSKRAIRVRCSFASLRLSSSVLQCAVRRLCRYDMGVAIVSRLCKSAQDLPSIVTCRCL